MPQVGRGPTNRCRRPATPARRRRLPRCRWPRRNEFGDDRDAIHAGRPGPADRRERPGFARVLMDMARERGFKGVVTARGAAALALARSISPTRSRSTSACRISTAGACSIASSTISRPATSPCYIITTEEEPRARPAHGRRRRAQRSRCRRRSPRRPFDAIHATSSAEPAEAARGRPDDEPRAARGAGRRRRGRRDRPRPRGRTPSRRSTTQRFDCVVIDVDPPEMTHCGLIERIAHTPTPRPAGLRLRRREPSSREAMRRSSSGSPNDAVQASARPSGCSTTSPLPASRRRDAAAEPSGRCSSASTSTTRCWPARRCSSSTTTSATSSR